MISYRAIVTGLVVMAWCTCAGAQSDPSSPPPPKSTFGHFSDDHIEAYINRGLRKAEPPPSPTSPDQWLLKTPEQARAAAARFVFGNSAEQPPRTNEYPAHDAWAREYLEIDGKPPPARPYPVFQYVGARLEAADDPWTPYVGRNDGRQVWRMQWRTQPRDGKPVQSAPAPDSDKRPGDLRYGVEYSVWIDPVDGAFLRAIIRRDQSGEPNSAMPPDACSADQAVMELWRGCDEYWQSCLVTPPVVSLAQIIEAGADQIGPLTGTLTVVHAVNWGFGVPTKPAWSFHTWNAPVGPVLGPVSNHHWVAYADTGRWYTGTGGAVCPKEPPPQDPSPVLGPVAASCAQPDDIRAKARDGTLGQWALELYQRTPRPRAEAPPAQRESTEWVIKSPDAARAAAARFVFGNEIEKVPTSVDYPFRAEWEAQQRSFNVEPPTGDVPAAYEFVDVGLGMFADPWTPYVGRNDGRSVWQVRWRTASAQQHAKTDDDQQASDLRRQVEIAVWIDPVDGAFLRAMVRHEMHGEPAKAMPANTCLAHDRERSLWGSGPEFWRACLKSSPRVGLIQILEAGTQQVGPIRGSLLVAHAVERFSGIGPWLEGKGEPKPSWCLQVWNANASPTMGAIANVFWVASAETGKFEMGGNVDVCPPSAPKTAPNDEKRNNPRHRSPTGSSLSDLIEVI